MSILRKGNVSLSNLRVKGPSVNRSRPIQPTGTCNIFNFVTYRNESIIHLSVTMYRVGNNPSETKVQQRSDYCINSSAINLVGSGLAMVINYG